MEKIMRILLYFAAPRRRRDHVDRNRKPQTKAALIQIVDI
jgi:hypothetical protein